MALALTLKALACHVMASNGKAEAGNKSPRQSKRIPLRLATPVIATH